MNKKIRSLVLFFLLVLSGSSYAFSMESYCADDLAFEATVSDENVYVTNGNNYMVFVPKNSDLKNETPVYENGIVFYPGGLVEFISYAPLMHKLAEQGKVCILLKVHKDLAILNLRAAKYLKPIQNSYDVKHWYLAGHSLGGTGASIYYHHHMDWYEGIIFLGSYSSADFSKTDKRFLLVRGSNDKILRMNQYDKALKKLPANRTEVVIDGGNHGGFGCYGHQNGDGNYELATELTQIEKTVEIIQDFFHN